MQQRHGCLIKDNKNMKAFEMWCYRQMQRINWIDRIPNDKVLLKINGKKELITIAKVRKLQ